MIALAVACNASVPNDHFNKESDGNPLLSLYKEVHLQTHIGCLASAEHKLVLLNTTTYALRFDV
jgi:hypothetical protein